jgi:hypothetical protein
MVWYGMVLISVRRMGVRSTISPPEGHVGRAKLWSYSATYTALESISCLRGYCYHFKLQHPFQLGRLSSVDTLGQNPFVLNHLRAVREWSRRGE